MGEASFLFPSGNATRQPVEGVRKWLTAPEMDARFGAENGNLIRNRKLLDPELKERETREHPELPGNQDGRWHYDFEKKKCQETVLASAIVASTHC